MAVDPLQHVGLVHAIAKKTRWKDGSRLDLDDFVQAGMIGLINAARRYRGGVSFATFAYPHIRGAMADQQRVMGCVAKVSRHHQGEHPDQTTDDALAYMADPKALPGVDGPLLRAAIRSLREPDRTMLRLYFLEDWQQNEIATRFGVTHSWVNQVLKRAVERLRLQLTR